MFASAKLSFHWQPRYRSMINKALRIGRIIISLTVFTLLTAGLTIASATIDPIAEWIGHIQLLPAVATFSIGVFVAWLIITLIFGRIYCSTACPIGLVQDASSFLFHRRKIYRYRKPFSPLRYTVLAVTVGCLMIGLVALPAFVDPYTLYLRLCSDCLVPAVDTLGLSSPASAPYDPIDTPLTRAMAGSALGIILTLMVMAVILLVSARSGRLVCSTVCPVGTTLGFVSRFAIFQIDIDTDKCIQCRRCADVCKAECLDLNDHLVDGSRCVNCFDCINVCPNDAIHYTTRRKQLSIPLMQSVKHINPETEATLDTAAPECDKASHHENTPR